MSLPTCPKYLEPYITWKASGEVLLSLLNAYQKDGNSTTWKQCRAQQGIILKNKEKFLYEFRPVEYKKQTISKIEADVLTHLESHKLNFSFWAENGHVNNFTLVGDGAGADFEAGFPFLKYLQFAKEIHFQSCENFTILPLLPSSLEELRCNCTKLKSFSPLPKSLKKIELSHCLIESLPKLPNTLMNLTIEQCDSLEELSGLPNSLQLLDCNNCHFLTTLPKVLPSELHSLMLSDCFKVSTIPKLPEHVRMLFLLNDEGLQEIAPLPSSIQSVTYINGPRVPEIEKIFTEYEKNNPSASMNITYSY